MIYVITIIVGLIVILVTLVILVATVGKSIMDSRRRKKLDAERKSRVEEIKATGFKPTKKFLGSGRMLAIDENQGTWYIMNYYHQPQNTIVHKIADIRSAEKIANKEYAHQSGVGVVLPYGLILNDSQIRSYYSKLGVLVKLSDKDCPVEFVNCYEDESEADSITAYLEILIAETKTIHG